MVVYTTSDFYQHIIYKLYDTFKQLIQFFFSEFNKKQIIKKCTFSLKNVYSQYWVTR